MAIKVFPVDATARPAFADAFGSHRGTDIFAPAGSPLLAVDNGDARADDDPKGGKVIYLRTDDGTVYYYAHLDAYKGSFPRRVSMGEEIGTVGTTGNAQGKDAHLHFEVHPEGSTESVDPYPLLLDVAPNGSVKLPVPVMPLPPNPLGSGSSTPPKKKAQALPGLWFWAWGQLLRRHTPSRDVDHVAQPLSGEIR
jgi:murein DD-endopeptidase MepM/ murein hydrolase activator NlpD